MTILYMVYLISALLVTLIVIDGKTNTPEELDYCGIDLGKVVMIGGLVPIVNTIIVFVYIMSSK